MDSILPIIAGAISLALLVLKWLTDKSKAKQAEREKLHAEWKEAVDSGDPGRIADMLTRMRAFKP